MRSRINNTGATGQSLQPKNDFEHALGIRNSANAVNLTYDRHTYRHTYRHTRKMVPITGRVRSFLLVFKNKIERRGRQNKNNRPINLPKCYNILHRLQVHHPILTFIIHNKYIIYIHTYIHTYIFCSSQLLLMIFFLLK